MSEYKSLNKEQAIIIFIFYFQVLTHSLKKSFDGSLAANLTNFLISDYWFLAYFFMPISHPI